jgi:nucleoside-diphosphate-sugar epimerase
MLTTILGAGGAIGDELAAILAAKSAPFRLVARNPKPVPGGEVRAADLSDREQTLAAVSGSSVVCLVVGLAYDLAVWRELWPRIMTNTIEACARSRSRLIFFDNVYAYGRANRSLTEQTPYVPSSKKGELRAKIAEELMSHVAAGNLTAMIARSADFYGPNVKNGVPNLLVLDPFAKGATASWLVNANVPHSLTFTPDAARGVALLAEHEGAWNQVWHLPTAPNPPTGREFVEMAAADLGVRPKYRVLSRPLLRLAGAFNSQVRESYEMLYQYGAPYLFDSTKFAAAFGFDGTPYAQGIRIAANAARRVRAS